jgi:uncharacterized protein (TIGR03435 family)
MILSQLQVVANHLWQSTLFAVVAGLLILALRKNRAQTRYCVWLAASVKFFVPFSLLVDVGSHIARQAAPAITPTGLSYVIEQASQPFSVPALLATSPVAVETSSINWIPIVFYTLWALGSVTLIFSWSRRWRGLREALRMASPLDLDNGMPAMTSPAFAEPGVFGIRRPVLLLPAGITELLTPAQMEPIVAHELCHVRRRDNVATAIHMGVEALFWFHPLVWWLGARLMEERERACDEEVLLTGSDPEAYAEGILKICELYLEPPLPCVAGVTRGNLKKRIEGIILKRIGLRLSFAKKAALAAAGVAALTAPIAIGILNAPTIQAQSASGTTTKFAEASIKPCAGGTPGGSPIVSPGRLDTGCAILAARYPMAGLIQRAYGRLGLGHVVFPGSALSILGGPAWIYSAYYVIDARAAGKTDKGAMEGGMLQRLLEERFQLKVHRETREVPTYALSVVKGGPKLQSATEGSCIPPDYSSYPWRQPLPPGKRYCDSRIGRKGSNTALIMEEATIDSFSKLLSLVMDRPIIDKSGIAGKYNFQLEFATDKTTSGGGLPAPPSDQPPAASIFAVMEQQLGLKLEGARGPREFLVIDHVERPAAN